MKQTRRKHRGDYKSSPPSRGVWIETEDTTTYVAEVQESPPSRGVWIETVLRGDRGC